MKIVKLLFILFFILIFPLFSQVADNAQPYEHDKWKTLPRDIEFNSEAFTGSFDSDDDDNNDGIPDIFGVAHWVSFEIRKAEEKHKLKNRPAWTTDPALYELGLAPDNETYTIHGASKFGEVKTDYRFIRGHLCPKETAERISETASYNTHTLLNAVPQLQWQNNGIWKTIEGLCHTWADKYGKIWVICGPLFFNNSPSMWLGENTEIKAAIPDALFKIIIREDNAKPQSAASVKTISFIIPNVLPKENKNPQDFITTIARIEQLSNLTFLNILDSNVQADVKNAASNLAEW